MCSYAANFLQICENFLKHWNNAMSNDGLLIENMDLSHIHLAVLGKWNFVKMWMSENQRNLTICTLQTEVELKLLLKQKPLKEISIEEN